MSTVILRLCGVQQAWGDKVSGVYRHTNNAPTQSGVMGLLGAASDCRPNDPNFPFHNLKMKVRTNKEGIKCRDYHTAAGFLTVKGTAKNHSEQTYRYYLQDADFFVALTGDDDIVNKAKEALIHPKGLLYLGRMSCPPSKPIFVAITDHCDPSEALNALKSILKDDDTVKDGRARYIMEGSTHLTARKIYDGPNHKGRSVQSIVF